jgi:ADP-ribosylglycohydrolase
MSRANEKAVNNSALWAAYGDALGFITELVDSSGVKRRVHDTRVQHTVPWQRLVGGKFGATVQLPAGSYSDDTQLRLSTSRAIRSDGYFDVEAFAKIELPVWLSYSLGGGLSTKAAANELTSANVAWFSNFFESKASNYFHGGGNGAAMRIQPHVWAASGQKFGPTIVRDVVRNAVCTHGHIRAIAGAVFHAEVLSYCLTKREIPGPDVWHDLLNHLEEVNGVVHEDRELSSFWLPVWESRSHLTLDRALREVKDECFRDIEIVSPLLDRSPEEAYEFALDAVGARARETRGSGTKTALISLILAWLFRKDPPEKAIVTAANSLGSDTDTIATMAGAVLGAIALDEPRADLQDRSYISAEAKRLFQISIGQSEASFEYPEVMNWRPPRVSLNVIAEHGETITLSGLGPVEPISELWQARKHDGTCWQWFRLRFGQTVLAKRRAKLLLAENSDSPSARMMEMMPPEPAITNQPELFSRPSLPEHRSPLEVRSENSGVQDQRSVDDLISEAIRSGFKEEMIGKHIVELAERSCGIELAVAYVSIIAKAKIARSQVSARRAESRS